MRIVSGEAKNKKLKSQKGHMVRPTMERIKESLFDIIKPYVPDSVFLDLFGGTGSIALEALSRGAKRAVIIEQNNEAIKIIIQNVNNLGFEQKCRAYKNDVQRAINILERKNEEFDLIFLDPPYKEELCTITIENISKGNLLKKTGMIMAEHHSLERLDNEIGKFVLKEERKYQDKAISFYVHKGDIE